MFAQQLNIYKASHHQQQKQRIERAALLISESLPLFKFIYRIN